VNAIGVLIPAVCDQLARVAYAAQGRGK